VNFAFRPNVVNQILTINIGTDLEKTIDLQVQDIRAELLYVVDEGAQQWICLTFGFSPVEPV
jgi:hypothetical protein